MLQLTRLLFEELIVETTLSNLNELDIKEIPRYALGLKAYELAYNKLLLKGLLHGNAKILNFELSDKLLGIPSELTRTKNSFNMAVSTKNQSEFGDKPDMFDRQKDAPFSIYSFQNGKVHDFIHLITTTAVHHFAPKNKQSESKFNTEHSNNKIFYKAIRLFKEKFGFSPSEIVKKYTGENLIGIIQYRDKSFGVKKLREVFDKLKRTAGIEKNIIDKDKLLLVENFIHTLFLERNATGRMHFQVSADMVEIANDGHFSIKASHDYAYLPQYDTEENAGNTLMFNLENNDIFLTPFAQAIRNSKQLSEADIEKMFRIIEVGINKPISRQFDINDTRIISRAAKYKEFITELFRPLINEYNHYIGLLNKMGTTK